MKPNKIITASFLEIMIFDPSGIRELHKRIPINSWLRNYIYWAHIQHENLTGYCTDTSGTPQSITPTNPQEFKAPASQHNYGLVVGTGTDPNGYGTYKLQTQIQHGIGAGQLNHQASLVGPITWADPLLYHTLSRSFINNSGATITVKEAGAYAKGGIFYIAVIRDLTGDIVIADTKTLNLQYYVKVTF